LDCRHVCKTWAFHDALQAGKQKSTVLPWSSARRRQIRRLFWRLIRLICLYIIFCFFLVSFDFLDTKHTSNFPCSLLRVFFVCYWHVRGLFTARHANTSS
jgi:hypothetical protein